MTDKEIRRIKDGVISIFKKFNILNHAATIGSLRDDILRLIDSMQERLGIKFKVGDKVKSNIIDGFPICTIEKIDDTVYYCDYTNFDIKDQNQWELVKEPKECMYSKDNYTDEDRKVLCEDCKEKCAYAIAGVISTNAQIKKESASEELEKVVEEIVDPTVLNAYGVKEIANRLRRTIIESVSDGQVKESLISKHEDKTCKENGNSLTQESVSEDLEKAAEQDVCDAVNTCSAIGIPNDHIPSWVQDAMVNEFIHGAQWKDKQLMAKAVDVTVHSDAGGYPCIPQIELYDYDKDIPLAKEVDKYKVILIKED